jgi:hypothetical protein
MRLLFVIGFIVLGFFNATAQERYVRPVDEAKKDASFLAFRTKLIDAARRRDAKYVLSIVDPNIRVSFGLEDGIKDFKKMWKIENPNSKFWDEFLLVLTNGGKFTREGRNTDFSAPYTFMNFPDDLDSFDYKAIFGNNVNLRARPDLSAQVVTQLSYNVVKVDYENSVEDKNSEGEYLWLKVETLGGKKGFVKSEFVRGPVDYRAIFEKKSGRWKMTAFIAGD